MDLRNYVTSVTAVSLSDDIKYKKDKDIHKIEEIINDI